MLHALKNNKRKLSLLLITLTFLAATVAVIANLQLEAPDRRMTSSNYTYETIQGRNDVVVHVMRTDPEFLKPIMINNNVIAAGIYGINGGFFWDRSVLSIAIDNGKPVNGNVNEYGSGWINEKYSRGTLVFDRITGKLTVQAVSSADEIEVMDRDQYWAQGGISMSLSDQLNWKQIASQEAIPFPDELRLRSGVVYDTQQRVYLMVSSVKCTAEQFREAIKDRMESYSLVDGIFLDGDGSSQMLSDEVSLKGDGRRVVQMIQVM